MTDEYQIEIPPSFYDLHTDARHRLTVPMVLVRQRYEVCEDLASHMVEHCQSVHLDIGVAEDEVLVRCHRGLASSESGVSMAEAGWVVTRLAELLGWAPIELEGPAG
jgi:hypothetical protein